MFLGPDPCEIGPVDLSGLESASPSPSPPTHEREQDRGGEREHLGDEGMGGPRHGLREAELRSQIQNSFKRKERKPGKTGKIKNKK